MGAVKKQAPWRRAVVDIRFGLLKRLSREFFADLGVPIPERELIITALEFFAVTRAAGHRPVPEVRVVVARHKLLSDLVDDLMREEVVSFKLINQVGSSMKRRK